MLSSILFGLLSVLGMMASATGLWCAYELCIHEWKDGRELVLLAVAIGSAGLSAWGSYTALANAWFEFTTRNY